jgi:hypothetical protein
MTLKKLYLSKISLDLQLYFQVLPQINPRIHNQGHLLNQYVNLHLTHECLIKKFSTHCSMHRNETFGNKLMDFIFYFYLFRSHFLYFFSPIFLYAFHIYIGRYIQFIVERSWCMCLLLLELKRNIFGRIID